MSTVKPSAPSVVLGSSTIKDYNKLAENIALLSKCGNEGPFKFEWKMTYNSDLSDEHWRGPYVIRTPDNFGSHLLVSGYIKWNDQGWGNDKGSLLYRLSRDK